LKKGSIKEDDKVKMLELITKTVTHRFLFERKQPVGAIREGRRFQSWLIAQHYNDTKDIKKFPFLEAKTEISGKNFLKKMLVLVSDFGLVTDITTRYDLINLDNR
jgi:hypothetical protein